MDQAVTHFVTIQYLRLLLRISSITTLRPCTIFDPQATTENGFVARAPRQPHRYIANSSFLIMFRFLILCAVVAVAQSKVYFHEKFADGWADRWVVPSTWKEVSFH